MPLPTITTPTYELKMPSTGKKIKYRPFLVKEEKILILALESKNQDEITNAVTDVLKKCILTRGVDVDSLPTFDIEYVFLNIRAKSIGEDIKMTVTCADDGETTVPVTIYVDEIKVIKPKGHTTDVVIDDVHNLDFEGSNYYQNFDLVLGNLPFNGNGKKITPGNKERNNLSTKYKATSILTSITHLMFQKVLKYGGLYYCIIPSIWMKEDRAGIYDLFCKKYKIHFIKCYDCYQAHKIFNYNCHTPICYLLVEKKYRIYPNINQFLPYIIEKQNYIINQIYIEQSKLYKNKIR